MSASFRKINYSLRPAKYAERRMMRDIFRRTAPFGHIEDCRYIGFGSLWFTDFVLFHRSLGIKNMVSIEAQKSAQKRVEANRPFEIKLFFESSSSALNRLIWTDRQLVWLDFDSALQPSMLNDIATVSRSSRSGSVVAVTINCQIAPEAVSELDRDLSGVDAFLEQFVNHPLPDTLRETDLVGKGYEELSRYMFSQTIQRTLNSRVDGDFSFQLVCSLRYADGARMITFVFLIFDHRDLESAEQCRFDEMDFLTDIGETVDIDVPILTSRECIRLETQLPLGPDDAFEYHDVPAKDAELFKRFYRHLPSFVVQET